MVALGETMLAGDEMDGRNIRQERETMYLEIVIDILLTLINGLLAMSDVAGPLEPPLGLGPRRVGHLPQ